MEVIRIPEERVGVFLAKNGEIKKRLEKLTKSKININKEGEIEIVGESIAEFFLKDIIKAIGRGFSPKDSEKLMKEDYCLEIINLKEICRNEKDLHRVKARIIGEKGKMKKEIEYATDSKISVCGWTIGIIAPFETMHYAKKAINKIIKGAFLNTVFNDLAKYKKEILGNRLVGR